MEIIATKNTKRHKKRAFRVLCVFVANPSVRNPKESPYEEFQ